MTLLDTIAEGTYRLLRALDRPAPTPHLRDRPRGVALIIALVTITVLSVAVVEYAYSTRVNLNMAVNAKNKVKSYFLARSAVNLSWLLLNFQYALQNESDKAAGNDDSAGGSCNPQMISVAMRRSNFQMYQYMDLLMRPFNNGKLETPVGGINLSDAGVDGFGKLSGNFDVDITPESGKLNINRFATQKVKQDDLAEFCTTIADSRYTEVFRRDDEDDQVLDQYRILRYIVDYIDLDEQNLPLTNHCSLDGQGSGSEKSQYDDLERNIEPRNAKLTHLEELHQVYGVTDAFMDAFGDKLTVYPVGKPNANNAEMPVFYSILCRNTRLGKNASGAGGQGAKGLTLCQRNPQIAVQVLYFAMALDGVRHFFRDPISVLMAYVGSTESRLLPSAKKGQPVAFLQSSQVYDFVQDFKKNPTLMARFIRYSPAYRRIASQSRKFRIDPRNPGFPEWSISFDKTGIIRSVSTNTPSIYRIKATGEYGSSKVTVETVMDFDETVRRLPNSKQLKARGADSERVKKLKKAARKREKTMPRGRVLYWRENVVEPVGKDDGSSSNQPSPVQPNSEEEDSQSSGDGFGSESGSGGGFGDDQGGGFGSDQGGGSGDDQGGGFGSDQGGGSGDQGSGFNLGFGN
ncbi:MAG: hypothetical protein ABEN55_08540 [Bradymonadaceae bacterium]